ncbi:MAG: hypothetical protein MUE54_00780 [Anaerolineae bacterium]|jgi:hypothetical protein|nr:hypothetical protein [Anaerolineae bacterium]
MSTPTLTHENRLATNDTVSLDKSLPLWARRSNPIIRRQLGAHWRVFLPEVRPIVTWIIAYTIFLALTFTGSDLLYIMFVPFALVSIIIFPGVLFVYMRTLAQIASDSAEAMVTEYTHDSLTLLRTTPFTGMEIILSKIAGSIWRRMDDLQDTTSYTRTLGGMAILGFYIVQFNPVSYPNVAQVLALPMLLASLVRIPLEMVMVACVASMIGAYAKSKSSAVTSTLIFTFFYFLLLTLLRFIGWSWAFQWVVDAVIPVILPIAISFGALKMTLRVVESD